MNQLSFEHSPGPVELELRACDWEHAYVPHILSDEAYKCMNSARERLVLSSGWDHPTVRPFKIDIHGIAGPWNRPA